MKTVLITGATSGFGHGLVLSLLQQGFQVIATGRKLTERPEIFKKEREKFNARLIEKNLDLTSKSDIANLVQEISGIPLHALINNAGFGLFGPAEECSEDKIRYQFEVNFFGMVSLTQKLLPKLRQSKGHIINFSSVLGITGFPYASYYCASKYAVEGFTESLAIEGRQHGLKVCLIEPGGYPTRFTQSTEWGDEVPGSVYTEHVRRFRRFRDKMSGLQGRQQKPQDVVEGVGHILRDDNPSVAYLFGKDAWATRILQRILPREWYVSLVTFVLNRQINKS